RKFAAAFNDFPFTAPRRWPRSCVGIRLSEHPGISELCAVDQVEYRTESCLFLLGIGPNCAFQQRRAWTGRCRHGGSNRNAECDGRSGNQMKIGTYKKKERLRFLVLCLQLTDVCVT